MQAGYRGHAPYVDLPVLPHGDAGRRAASSRCSTCSSCSSIDQPPMIKLGICLAAAYLGMQLPSCS